jgi:hypothetical protein
MDIECRLRRPGGSKIEIGNTEYHFKPLSDGAHVAAVADEQHQDRLLGIPEAYKLYRGKATGAPAPVTIVGKPPFVAVKPGPVSNEAIAIETAIHPASFDIHGVTYALDDIIVLAQNANGFDATSWQDISDDMRADLIDEELDKLADAGVPTPGEQAEQADPALVAAREKFKTKFGKAPHYRWTVDKIKEQLADA